MNNEIEQDFINEEDIVYIFDNNNYLTPEQEDFIDKQLGLGRYKDE